MDNGWRLQRLTSKFEEAKSELWRDYFSLQVRRAFVQVRASTCLCTTTRGFSFSWSAGRILLPIINTKYVL